MFHVKFSVYETQLEIGNITENEYSVDVNRLLLVVLRLYSNPFHTAHHYLTLFGQSRRSKRSHVYHNLEIRSHFRAVQLI